MVELYNGRKAAVGLSFVIVGAGPAGLATAFALTKAGHECLVLESSKELLKAPGVYQVPSNLTKILSEWGIDHDLAMRGSIPLGMELLKYRTAERMGGVTWNDLMVDATGCNYYLVDRPDLVQLLYELARGAGVDIQFGCKVVEVNPNEPSVTLDNEEVIYGDVIVGADGDQSTVRNVVLGYHDQGVATGRATYAAQVPIEKMQGDADLEALANSRSMLNWLGPDRVLFGLSMKQAGKYAVYLIHPMEDENTKESWMATDNVESLREQLSTWDPRIVKLSKLIKRTADIKAVQREVYDTWVHDSGKVVLVGDACHPMPMYAIHKTAVAVEDAAVLGNLFSRLESRDNIGFFLNAYQELRETRCAAILQDEESRHHSHSLREGTDEDLDERDEELREKYLSKHVTPEQLEMLWGLGAQFVKYEVDPEVDGWWKDFGAHMSSRGSEDRRMSGFLDLGMATTVVTTSTSTAVETEAD